MENEIERKCETCGEIGNVRSEGIYRLLIQYDREPTTIESIVSNVTYKIHIIDFGKFKTEYDNIPYELYKVAKDFIEQTMKERNIIDDYEIDIREILDYVHSIGMAKLMKVIEYQSGSIVAKEVDDAYIASYAFYAEEKYSGYELELGYVFDDVKNYIEGNNILVMPQKYVKWVSEDNQTMTDWEDICNAWMGFVKPISKDDIEYVLQSIADDKIVHPSGDEIERMRKAFSDSDNHYYDDY